ncbi:MAG: hypothetical protein ROZ37_13760 [Aromatoleum sp.]|jgi:heme O synthase-like polyprenyltransferase|uniref:hypothetical protein n=1 Tax=Aromatoleum sp. TaxID=2307007 RepID=UPI00289393B6|nr:hypothetical protein [Aromatoleum sp.]MDT3671381.1 hypothetical protein [Aromatoleum sp.]
MLVIRLFGVLALIGIGGSLIAWMLTGNPRYRVWAWNFFRAALIVVFVFLALLALERVFLPLA